VQKEGIFAHGLGFSVIYQGIAIAALTLISYFIGNTQSHITGTTMAFLTMSVCEVFQALNLRSMTKSIFRLKTRNKVLFGAMVMAFVLSLFVIYVPGINDIFKLTRFREQTYLFQLRWLLRLFLLWKQSSLLYI